MNQCQQFLNDELMLVGSKMTLANQLVDITIMTSSLEKQLQEISYTSITDYTVVSN